MSDIKIMQRKINSELNTILNDFDGQYDLIEFDKEKFMPINYELIKNFDFENFNDSDCILTNISKESFDLKYDELNGLCQQSIEKYGISNTYVSFGLIEFKDYLAPAILIPIFLERTPDEYKIHRNFNQEIQFNGILKFIMDEENIDFPNFDGNLNKFLKQIENFDEFEYIPESYVGNFDLKFQHFFHDLNTNNWKFIKDTFEEYKNNAFFGYHEIDVFKNNLEEYAKELNIDFKEDILFLKTLLSMGKSILVIADSSKRNQIKEYFKRINLENFLLELSENLSKVELYESILSWELTGNDDIEHIDYLTKKHDEYALIVDLINKDYGNIKVSPKEMKEKKDSYFQEVKDHDLKNFDYDIKNIEEYDMSLCERIENQIKKVSKIDKTIFYFPNFFSMEYLHSNSFKNLVKISKSIEKDLDYFSQLNQKLNKKYGIKIFQDLFTVIVLYYISILDKNPVLVENDDLNRLNEYIVNYNDDKSMNLTKYLIPNLDPIQSIDVDLKFTELIKHDVIDENSLESILNNFEEVKKESKHLIDISNFILKNLNEIILFYKQFDYFNIDSNLLDLKNNINDFKVLINIFKMHIGDLIDYRENYVEFNIINNDVYNIINLIFENGINENEIGTIFWYNVYNSILNKFLNEYPFIDENKILSDYESKLNSIYDDLMQDKRKLLIHHIYSKPLELNNQEKTLNQKEEIIKKHTEKDFDLIKVTLNKFKEYITANKRVYMMDMDMVSQFLDSSYENHFDYIILTNDVKYDLDILSLLLRSKNRIIKVKS